MTPGPRLLGAVALGGAAGAVVRWALTDAFPDGTGFPWTVLTINVVGSLLLSLLPAIAAVRRSPTLAVALGPGVLGGFTTLSTYSQQARDLLAAGHDARAAAYLLGTLGACLAAVALGSHLSTLAQQQEFEDEEGDD